MSDKPLLSVAEAARHLGLHHAAIRRAIERGELPASKVCSRIRIDPTDLHAWVRKSRVTPTKRDLTA